MVQHSYKSSKDATARRNVRFFPRSRAVKPLFHPYQDILRRLRERLWLLEILQCRRAPPEPALASGSKIDSRKPTWEVFLNQLSWLCDYGSGGDSTSSIAVEATPWGPKYWLAANFDPKMKGPRHLKAVLEILARLKKLPLDMNRSIAREIMEASLAFSARKFQFYKKSFEKAMHFAGKSVTRGEDSYEERLLARVETISELKTPLEVSIFAYRSARTSVLRKVHRKHRKYGPKNAGSAWYEVCHYIGRLGSWVRSILVLVHFVRRYPQVLENFSVGSLPAPRIPKPIFTDQKPRLHDVLQRMLPEDKARAAKLYQRLQDFRAFDFDAAFTRKCRSKNTKYDARSHSELVVLDRFQLKRLSFFEDVKFVASSKRSCYCCNLFFDLHNSNITTRPSHGNAWSKWCLPPGLERADKKLLGPIEMTVLERMTERISLDIIQLIETGVPRRVRFKDSSTGMWTAPTLGLSAM